ncbi:hypothetical protein GCM10010518_20560 [Kitasatospora cinereorecta]
MSTPLRLRIADLRFSTPYRFRRAKGLPGAVALPPWRIGRTRIAATRNFPDALARAPLHFRLE